MGIEKTEAYTQTRELPLNCPACSAAGTTIIYEQIDGTTQMRDRILTDSNLFMYECPHCGERVRIEAPCIYVDEKRKIAVWNMPDPKFEFTEQALAEKFGNWDISDYTCRITRSWGELREKIIELESSVDDRICEVIKSGAYSLIKAEDRKVLPLESYHIDYCTQEGDSRAIGLVFMRSDMGGQAYVYPLTDRVIKVTDDIFRPLLDGLDLYNRRGEFFRFTYETAHNFVMQTTEAAQEQNKKYEELISLWVKTLAKELYHVDL
ncbi:MAG: hypothetical protein HXM51_01845 [Megasphaera micronuciformis]|uniref:CpXC domain-containing protein n=1 Tax=Megasphaera micronuciformis TaxID=187326 RepID=UPI001CAC76B4|nr:hypothetical protein [Megasphaera micronuciformis]